MRQAHSDDGEMRERKDRIQSVVALLSLSIADNLFFSFYYSTRSLSMSNRSVSLSHTQMDIVYTEISAFLRVTLVR